MFPLRNAYLKHTLGKIARETKKGILGVFLLGIFLGYADAAPKLFEFKGLVIGEKASPSDVTRNYGVKCGLGFKGMQVCNGLIRIGSVITDANIVISPDGFLQRATMRFDAKRFPEIAGALIEKYGVPDTEEGGAVQNGFGATFKQSIFEWKNKEGVRLLATKYSGTIDKSEISFTTVRDRALTNAVGRVGASDL